jgi:hypothetical protein
MHDLTGLFGDDMLEGAKFFFTDEVMSEREIDTDRIDEAVLALMYLGLHDDRPFQGSRTWKSFDWDALERLHAKDLIQDPVSKAKSVTLTEEGERLCEELFLKLFGKQG